MSVYSGRAPTVQRWVITHVHARHAAAGLRSLTFACQGRWTYDSKEVAERELELWKGSQGLPRVLTAAELATLEVRECECWAGGHDPCGMYFD